LSLSNINQFNASFFILIIFSAKQSGNAILVSEIVGNVARLTFRQREREKREHENWARHKLIYF